MKKSFSAAHQGRESGCATTATTSNALRKCFMADEFITPLHKHHRSMNVYYKALFSLKVPRELIILPKKNSQVQVCLSFFFFFSENTLLATATENTTCSNIMILIHK